MNTINARLRAKYAAGRQAREGHEPSRRRFNIPNRFAINCSAWGDHEARERRANTVVENGPYRGRTQLDQSILAAIHLTLEDHLCPDWYLEAKVEYDRLDAAWYLYSQSLNL